MIGHGAGGLFDIAGSVLQGVMCWSENSPNRSINRQVIFD